MARASLRYLVAMLAAIVALAIVRLLHPMLDAGSYFVFLGAIVTVAAVGGLRPALVTTLLAVAAIDWFFLAPKYSLALLARTDALLLALFGGVAVLATSVMEWLRRGRALAERRALEAAGVASLMRRDAEELSHEVEALFRLRKP